MTEQDPNAAFERRAALIESNGRRVNEAIERGHRGSERASFVCECGRLGCTTTVEMSLEAYEQVRSGSDRFLIVPSHELPDVEHVIERHDGYVVVAKEGAGADVAADTDPREHGDSERA